MSATQAGWQRTQQFNWGGVRYEILVIEQSAGLFQASWSCGRCGENGALEPIATTLDEVVTLARIGIRVHHQILHFR
jgi:hypothetical protein